MTVMPKELQITKLKEFFKKKGIVTDTVDWEAETDEVLTFFENKKHFLEQLNLSEDLTKKQIEAQTQSVEKENLLKIEEEVNADTKTALDLIKAQNSDYILPQLESLSEGVKMLSRGHFAGLFCVSAGGFGKSFAVVKALADENQEYELINTHVSPIAFYEFLYKHNGKIILIEDSEHILENEVIVSILRSALWSALVDKNGEMIRTITLHTAWKEADHLPKSFVFTGKIILLANKLPKEERMEALISRVLMYNLNFSVLDVKKMLLAIAKKGYKNIPAEKCVEIATELCNAVGVEMKNLNLRLFHKAIELYRYNATTWVKSMNSFFDIDDELKLVGELMKSNLPIREQINRFITETGYGRRKFFYLKKKYLELSGVRA